MVKRIICIGDSITFGSGEYPCLGWVGRLKKQFEKNNVRFHNLGIGGDTSKDVLKRVEVEVGARTRKRDPDDFNVVILSVGSNDAKSALIENKKVQLIFSQDYKKNMESIISKIISLGVNKLYLISILGVDESRTNPFNRHYWNNHNIDERNKILMDLSSKLKIDLIDVSSITKQKEFEKFLVDGVHPNNLGYDLMYEIISYKLKEDKIL